MSFDRKLQRILRNYCNNWNLNDHNETYFILMSYFSYKEFKKSTYLCGFSNFHKRITNYIWNVARVHWKIIAVSNIYLEIFIFSDIIKYIHIIRKVRSLEWSALHKHLAVIQTENVSWCNMKVAWTKSVRHSIEIS